MLRDDKKVGSFPISWDGLCVSAAGEGNDEVAIGGADNLIHIYALGGNTLTEVRFYHILASYSSIQWNPVIHTGDGWLACAIYISFSHPREVFFFFPCLLEFIIHNIMCVKMVRKTWVGSGTLFTLTFQQNIFLTL